MTFWRLYYNIKARFLEHLKKKINIHLGKLKKFDISIPWHHTLLCCLSTICIKLSRAWVGQGAEHSALNSNGQMYSNVQRGWLGLDNDILTSAINPPGVEVSANIMGVGARPLCHYIRHSQGCENATSEKVIQLKSYYFKMIEMRYLFNIHTILYLHTAYFSLKYLSIPDGFPLSDGMCHKCEYLGINGHESWHRTIGQYFTTWHLHLTKINCDPSQSPNQK